MSDVQRIFLGWSTPPIERAAAWLVQNAHEQDQFLHGAIDLASTICVVNGGRTQRLLEAELMRAATAMQLNLLPPRVVTLRHLPSLLVSGAAGAVASELELEMAWLAALVTQSRDMLHALLPQPPAHEDHASWLAIARELAELHELLAGHELTFADVSAALEDFDLPRESARWNVLTHVQQAVDDNLHAAGLSTQADAIRNAIEHATRAGTVIPNNHDRVVLIGLVECPPLMRQMLARTAARVTALIAASEEMSERFDAMGALVAGPWCNTPLPIAESDVIVADRPRDQVQAALRAIAAMTPEQAKGGVTIGLGDETVAQSLKRNGRIAGIEIRLASGSALIHTRPMQALQRAGQWLREPRFHHFAELVRQIDIESIASMSVRQSGNAVHRWIELIDRYFNEHLSGSLDGQWLGDERNQQSMAELYHAVNAILEPLAGDARPLHEWAGPLLKVLDTLFGWIPWSSEVESQREAAEACLQVFGVLKDLQRVPASLQPTVDGPGAIELITTRARHATVPEATDAGDVEAVGWLELAGDLSHHVVLLNVNDGSIPSTSHSHRFLPDMLRTRLGLPDDRQRTTRDRFLLEQLIHSRTKVTLIVGRRDRYLEPLAPSRFLLACERERLPARLLQLADHKNARAWSTPLHGPVASPRSVFVLTPAPADVPVMESLRVTHFKTYMECPYRFWLGQVLRLDDCSDDIDEMDGGAFGSLAHDVLEAFTSDASMRACSDVPTIAAALSEILDAQAAERFGPAALPAVRVQVERLRERLRAFAPLHAEWVRDGWRTIYSELNLPEHATLTLDDGSCIRITGKIDRIDQHADGRIRILDYKTGKASSPEKAHRSKRGWIDLQLPLYHHFYVNAIDEKADAERVELAYIQIPPSPAGVCLDAASWTSAELQQAVDRAREIAGDIRSCQFKMEQGKKVKFDKFENICQTAAFVAEDVTYDG
ncbi:MAG: PD-(D/E)XK nuclease family protein [Phycisphaerales bacterium]